VDASALRKTSSNQPVDADYGEVQYTAIDTNRNNRNSTSGGTLVDGNNHYDMAAPGRGRANTLRQADIVYAMPGLEEALAGDVVYSSDAAAAAAAVVTYATAANDANAASALYSEPAKKRTLRKQANDNSSPPTSAAPLSAGGARGGISIVAVYGDANSSDSDGDDSDLEV